MIVLTACTGSLPDDGGNPSPEERGEPVLLSFDMYGATVTKASENTAVDLAPETKFTIYAFPKGTTDLSKPLASGVYTIEADYKATGNMSSTAANMICIWCRTIRISHLYSRMVEV